MTPDLGPKLADLAEDLATEALDADIDTKLDIFKVLYQYHIGITKVLGKVEEPDPDAVDFARFASATKEPSP